MAIKGSLASGIPFRLSFSHVQSTELLTRYALPLSGRVPHGVTKCFLEIGGNAVTGLSCCMPEDVFDRSVGRKLSLVKALSAFGSVISKSDRATVWHAYRSHA